MSRLASSSQDCDFASRKSFLKAAKKRRKARNSLQFNRCYANMLCMNIQDKINYEIPAGRYDLQYVKSNGRYEIKLANISEKEVIENLLSFFSGKHYGCTQIRTLNRATGRIVKF